MPRPKLIAGEKDARERIIDAFWEFAQQMPIQKISVQMLSGAAGCNRSTFYYYFDGVMELFEQAMERAGFREILAREFSAVMAGEGGKVVMSSNDLAMLDDLCTVAYVNRAGLEQLGAVDQLISVWSYSTGIDPESLSPERRALLEFATQGFLATLSYRGSVGNTIPYESLVRIVGSEVAPSLMQAIAGK